MSERVVSDLYSIASSKGVDLDSEIVGVYGPAISVPDAYDVWIHQHRKVQILPDPVKDPKLNPFMRLVVAVGSLSRMAALLAVHDHIVERYAKGITYEMPMTVMMALTDMQYPHIVALEQAMKKWGETHA